MSNAELIRRLRGPYSTRTQEEAADALEAAEAHELALREALQGLLVRCADPDEEYGPDHAVTIARAALALEKKP